MKKWIAAYGDPRIADIDPIDWVERIPFSETRNYVQRVMENLQVYRNRLGGQEALAHRGRHAPRRQKPLSIHGPKATLNTSPPRAPP